MLNSLNAMNGTRRNAIALACLLVASILASLNYPSSFLWVLPSTRDFRPDLISGIAAALLVLPVVRGDFLYTHRFTPLTVINLLLIFYLTACFAQIGLGGNTITILKSPAMLVTFVVIALANFRPGKYGELAVIVLAVYAGVNILSANEAMEIWGFMLVATAFFGVLFAVDVRKVARTISHPKTKKAAPTSDLE